MAENFNVNKGDYVRIALHNNPRKHFEGEIHRIVSNGPDGTNVILTTGDAGMIINVIDSDKNIEKRIMNEGQYTENKEKFGEDVMRNSVIPKTVQSFLNSDGGYLYIGVHDTGTLQERLVGLDYDFDLIRSVKPDANIDKLCDLLELKIMSTLEKYLTSDTTLGNLIKINFPQICNIRIVEIKIKKSSFPWFFKNLTKANKVKQFKIQFSNESAHERILDDFYIRVGNKRKRLDTIKEFYEYSKERF